MRTWKTLLSLSPLGLLTYTGACHTAEAPDPCYEVALESSPVTSTLRDVVIVPMDPERAIAVGASGAILTRTAGAWIVREAAGDTAWSGVAADVEGVVVTVGAGGSIARSDDHGATWLASVSPTGVDLHDVAVDHWGTRDWLAVGDGEVLFARAPGQEFSRVELPPGVGSLHGVAFGGEGDALAVGEGGQVLRSPDRVQWSFVAESGPVDFVAVVHAPEEGEEPWLLLGGDGVLYRDPKGEAPWYVPPGPDRMLALSGRLLAGENGAMRLLWPEIMPLDGSLDVGNLNGADWDYTRSFVVGDAGVIVSVRRKPLLACGTSSSAESTDR